MDQYPTSGVGGVCPSSDPRGGNSEQYDSYRERSRYPPNARDHGYEPKAPYPRGRAYENASRYYN